MTPVITEGRRVETFDDLERAGDYCTANVDDHGTIVPYVYFLLPCHEGDTVYDRPTECSGAHGVSSPPWTFRECPDGSVEIRRSILAGGNEDRPEGYWHGFLDEGHRWRQVG